MGGLGPGPSPKSGPVIAHMLFPIVGPLEQSLSPAVFEVLRSKRIGVTRLTFQGHVTSSVT